MDTRRRAEDVFEAALELQPAERSEYVAQVCAYDAGLLRQVLALLGAHERADGVLDVDARVLMRDAVEPMPERLGAYRVVREIGRGGMGIVYEAERDDGQFVRRVAIKVLRVGVDPALRQRVLAERQILASLEHADIARLLDGGITADGRPYLVMEHVEGLPVDVFCDRMRLSVAERLRLFNVIARAVAYAHRNLVVHRDLKPSNILVTADGQVKLLDFGVAKLLNPALRGLAAHTLHDRLAFTPEYASPEQLRGEALTTVSDVYALGVLLYELLTGRRPFNAAGLAPLLRAVAEDDAEPPSVRVARDETVPQLDGGSRDIAVNVVARGRHTTPARLARTLRGDLDAIVVTALCKEPPGRYGSAELLVEDVERYLDGRPVLAQRRGRAYALGKLIRRHRMTAAALGLAVVSLVMGLGASLWQAAAARNQRDRAETARAEAEQVTEFMVRLFEVGPPGGLLRAFVSPRDLVRRGMTRIDELSGQPLVQARMLGALGRAYDGLGDYEEGQRLTERAVAILDAQPQRDETTIATLLLQRGILQRRRSEFDSAQASFFGARAAAERAARSPELHAEIMLQLASIAIYRGDLIEAERRTNEALEEQIRELGETHALTVNTLGSLASVQWRRGKPEAEATFRRVIALRPRVTGYTAAELAQDRLSLATMLLSENMRLDEAESIFRDVVAATPPAMLELLGLAVWARHGLATVLAVRGNYAEAERLRREDLAMRRDAQGERHPGIAESLAAMSMMLMRAGRLEESQRHLDEAMLIARETVGERHPLYAGLLSNLAELRLAQNDLVAADSLMSRAVEIRGEVSGRTGSTYALGMAEHAVVKTRMREFATAERMLQDALALLNGQIVEGGRDRREIHHSLAQLYAAWGRPRDAARQRALAEPVPIHT